MKISMSPKRTHHRRLRQSKFQVLPTVHRYKRKENKIPMNFPMKNFFNQQDWAWITGPTCVTSKKFALEILEKKCAAELAKQQWMGARVLRKRIPKHVFIVNMYHTLEDYTAWYYLLELHSLNRTTNTNHTGQQILLERTRHPPKMSF